MNRAVLGLLALLAASGAVAAEDPREESARELESWCSEEDGACGAAKGETRSIQELETGCEAGKLRDCVWLARWLAKPGEHRDVTRAVRLLRRACDANDGFACSLLGWHYTTGDGVPARDLAEAARLAERACALRDFHGCANFAAAVVGGLGVEKDPARGLDFALRACDGGSEHGCSVAGDVLLFGSAGERDPARAVKLLERACTKKEANACAYLAAAVAYGDGTERDRPQGVRLARSACEMSPHGCFVLAIILMDLPTAAEWKEGRKVLADTCERGYEAACSRMEELGLRKPKDQKDPSGRVRSP